MRREKVQFWNSQAVFILFQVKSLLWQWMEVKRTDCSNLIFFPCKCRWLFKTSSSSSLWNHQDCSRTSLYWVYNAGELSATVTGYAGNVVQECYVLNLYIRPLVFSCIIVTRKGKCYCGLEKDLKDFQSHSRHACASSLSRCRVFDLSLFCFVFFFVKHVVRYLMHLWNKTWMFNWMCLTSLRKQMAVWKDFSQPSADLK